MNEETKRFILWLEKVPKWRNEAEVLCTGVIMDSQREMKTLWGARLREWAINTGMFQGPFTDLAYIGYDQLQWSIIIKHFRRV